MTMELASDMVLDHHRMLGAHILGAQTSWRPVNHGDWNYWQEVTDGSGVHVYVRRRANTTNSDLIHVGFDTGVSETLRIGANGRVRNQPRGWYLDAAYCTPRVDYWVCRNGDAIVGDRQASVEIEWTDADRTHLRRIRVWGQRNGDPFWLTAPQEAQPETQPETQNICQPDPELERLLDEEEAIAQRAHAAPAPLTVEQYETAFRLINDKLNNEAVYRGWCSDFEVFVDQVNAELPDGIKLDGRDRGYRGTLNISFEFSAGRNGESREGMMVVRDSIRELLERFGTLREIEVSAHPAQRL